MNMRKFLWVAGVAGALCVPAFAQYQQPDRQHDQDDHQYQQPDQRQHDQDDRARRDDDQNRVNRDNGYHNQNQQWRNTKAYQKGLRDGEHDRSKNMGERVDRRHWKNDQDRQAYEAGYYEAYRSQTARHRDRDDQRRDRDDRDH